MSLPYDYYLKHVFKNTRYRANWLPNRPLNIGDIGQIRDGLFILRSNLNKEKIKFKIRESSADLDFDYSSKNAVTIETSGSANATGSIPGAELSGKVIINFNKTNGIIFQMHNSKKVVIENFTEIENEILSKYEQKKWSKDWVIVTEIIIADNATIIISTSNTNKIELACDAQFGLGPNKLADPKLKLTLVSEKGSSTKILGSKGIAPLFQISGIYQPFLSKPQFRLRKSSSAVLRPPKLEILKFDPRELET
jgi:hypothetical protein